MLRTEQIHIRDPFVLPHAETGSYYLYGTTDREPWRPPAQGFDCYRSSDLQNWEGPIAAFRPPSGFWADRNFWAAEVHRYRGGYYMFASFKAEKRFRGTQILYAPGPEGPYRPISAGPITPSNWECLDGTLHVDEDGVPWIVFSHEWVQVHDGSIWAMPLAPDLKSAAGRPVFLFSASEAAWVRGSGWPTKPADRPFPCYITDGPYLYRAGNGELLMLWSSRGAQGYTMGVARSSSGAITGPWTQDEKPLWEKDGGHGMIFRTFEGQLMLTFHMPNRRSEERARFVPIREEDGRLVLLNTD